MRRICTNFLLTLSLLLATTLLTACSPNDVAQMMKGDQPENENNSAAAALPPEDDEPAEPEREEAKVGVGKKGHYDGAGPLRTPVAAGFRALEKIAFDRIPRAIQEYKVTHDFKGPQSHEEFMEVIIKPYGIKLPELYPGERYEYDPKDEKLYVVRDTQEPKH